MPKGFSTLLIIIFIAFLSLPILFWAYSNSKQKGEAKGAISAKNGFSVYITSNSGTWKLRRYLCESKQECLSSLDSGEKLENISGGITEKNAIHIKYLPNYSNYSYMKIYVESGWNSTPRLFKALSKGDINDTAIYDLEETNVALIPLQSLKDSHKYSVHFSD